MRKSKVCGIYQIKNLINGKMYIGSSNDIYYRFRVHRRNLCSLEHSNSKLQNAWNKYGGGNFVFEIIEVCLEDERICKEQTYIDTLKPFYNISKTALVPSFKAGTLEAKIRSQKNMEARNKSEWCNSDEFHEMMSGIMAERWKNPEYRNLRSANTEILWSNSDYRNRQSVSHSKLSSDDRKRIKELSNGRNSRQLAEMFGVSRGTIYRVLGNKWTHQSVLSGKPIDLEA